MATSNWNKDILAIKAIKSSEEKVDRVAFHPVQSYIAYGSRSGGITVWNYDSNEIIYTNQLGGADDGALQEFSLRQRAEKSAASLGGPIPPTLTAAQEASLNAKSTASGAVHDIQFYDLDTCFWQLAAQHSLQYSSYDTSSIPTMTNTPGLRGKRWIVAAFENKVTLHDLNSSESLDISRSAAFESKSPTRLAFLLLNAPSLIGSLPRGKSDHDASHAPLSHLSPILAVGTASGSIYLVSPNTGSVFAKLTGGHRSSVTSLLTLGASTPHGPDRLLSSSADGTIALWDPSQTPKRGADREISPVKTFKAHDSGVRDMTLFMTMVCPPTNKSPHSALSNLMLNNPITKAAATTITGATQVLTSATGAVGNAAVSASAAVVSAALPASSPSTTTTATTITTTATTQQQQEGTPKQTDGGPDLQQQHAAPANTPPPTTNTVPPPTPPASSTAQSPSLPVRIATVGDDRKISIWDISTWRLLSKIQALPKASCHSIKFSPWGGAGLGVHPSLVVASGESTVLMGLVPGSNHVEPLISLQGMVDPGQKKVPKIYHIAVHPTRPHLVAAATNTGVILLTSDPIEKPAVVGLPSQVLTLEALMNASGQQKEEENPLSKNTATKGQPPPPPPTKGAAGFTYVVAAGNTLWSTAYRMEARVKPGASDRTVTLESAPHELIATLEYSGRPILSCSPSGRSISAVWPENKTYVVYSLAPTGTWEVIDRGSGNCLVWASTASMYALISVSNIPTAMPKAKKGLLGIGAALIGGKKAAEVEEEREREAAMAMARAAAAATTVQIHHVDEAVASQYIACHNVGLAGAQPAVLHGGALAGVVVIDPVTLRRSLRFFSWTSFDPVGPPLPEPQWISWEPECTICALAYEHTVELCRVHPTFQRFAALSLSHAQAGLWASRQLFVSTPSSVHVVFADPSEEFVQEIVVASFEGGVASKTAPAVDASPLPAEQMRPAGPITIIGVRHSYLWLSDAFGRPFLISLRHPGIRLRCLAARGELTTARMIAERSLSPAFHDDVARFLAAMSPGDGVKEGLLLPGLTPHTEMALCIRDGAWDRAARCFQALILDVTDKALLVGAGDGAGGRVAADTFTGLSLGGSVLRADHTALVEEILHQHETVALSSKGKMATSTRLDGTGGGEGEEGEEGNKAGSDTDDSIEDEGVLVDPVQWDLPLMVPSSHANDQEAAKTSSQAIHSTPPPSTSTSSTITALSVPAVAISHVIDPGELCRVSKAGALGLRFADAAIASGHEDAARAALGVLVQYAAMLPASLLQELVARMGQCRMSESTRNLAVAASHARPGSSLLDPGVASLLASLSGGGIDGEGVQATLHAAGLAPLSAVYASVWNLGDKEMALKEWKSQLGSGGEGGSLDGGGVSIVAPLG